MRDNRSARWWNSTVGELAGLTMLAASLLSCGDVGSDPEVALGVPYRAQTNGCFDCAPASILMWRRYDGLSELSLGQIGGYIGTTCSAGTHPNDIADGVNHFTDTIDAFWDIGGGNPTARDKFFSRQITSIDAGVPVLAIVQGGFHIGAINGGKWHENANGDYQWDFVKFHDSLPGSGGPNLSFTGSAWSNYNCNNAGACEQVASSGAMAGWFGNYNTYNDDVVLGGGGGGGPCGGPCDQEPLQ